MSLNKFWFDRMQTRLKSLSQTEHWLITRHHRHYNAACFEYTHSGEPACAVVRETPSDARIEWLEWKDGKGKPFQCTACAAHWRNYASGEIRKVVGGR